jgi:ligand-binding sensor protein
MEVQKMAEIPMELFLSDEVQGLLDDFASLLDIRVTFYSLAGEPLRRGKEMRNCTYCSLVQEKLDGYSRCVSMDCNKQQEAVKKLEIINYRCHAGVH